MTHRSLAVFLLALTLLAPVQAQQAPAPRGERGQPIEPEVARHAAEVPRIHARDLEIGLFFGTLSIENFSTEPVYGLRLGYHLSEDFFIEGSFGRSQVSDDAYRTFMPVGVFDDDDLTYYHLSLNYNVLPGEFFLGRGRAFTGAVFLSTGLGNTRFGDEDYFTYSLGLGARLLPTDSVSLRLDFRQFIFETDLFGDSEWTFNPELTIGLAAYF